MTVSFPRLRALGIAGLAIAAIAASLSLWADAPPAATAVAASPAKAPPPPADGIALAAADAAAVTQASAPDAWGGPRTGTEPTLSDRVVSYQISASLDPVKHTLDGQQKLTWRNRSKQAVSSVYLHLYLNAFESYGSTFFTEQRTRGFSFRSDVPIKDGEWGHIRMSKVQQGGAAVPWMFVQPDGGPETDHTVVRLDLPQPVPAGQSTTLDIDFAAKLPRVIARTGYFGSFHLVGQWFPKMAVLELPGERGATAPRWNAHEFHLHSEFYADYGHYDVSLTVPKGYTVGATGEEQGPPVEKDGKLTYRFVQGDVHDFAWTADNRTAKPLEGVYNGPGSPPVKVKVLYPPEYESNAAPVLKATIDSLAYFSKTLGPYPYKTVTAVIPPHNAGEAGGMEYPTFFTADNVSNLKPDTTGSYSLDFVTIHEFGHGYFYGIIGSNEFEEPMLDEGLNEYWNSRMLRESKLRLYPLPGWLRALGVNLSMNHFDISRVGADRSEPQDALGHNSWDRLSSSGYGSVYSRTATTMRDLEERLTTPVMEKAFLAYYARWKFRHPSIADLRDTLAEVSGKPEVVNAVFAQQVYATRKVDDSIAKFSSKEVVPMGGSAANDKGEWVDESEEQVDKKIEQAREAWKKAHPDAKDSEPGPFPYRTMVTLRRKGAAVPQTLVVKFADGSSETVKWDNNDNWARYSWVKPAKAVSAELDGQRMHYLDASKLDDSRTLKAERSASQRWGSQFAALVQVIASLIATL